jgi:hypothetical protein
MSDQPADPETQSRLTMLLCCGGASLGVIVAVVAFLLVSGGGGDDGTSTARVTDLSTPTVEATVEATATPDGASPPATGPATIEEALALEFEAEASKVSDCATATFDDTLCYAPYLTNLEAGRYLMLVGAPFSEVFAWALVEQQGDGTYLTTQVEPYDFEGDGEPPFEVDGPMASVQFTSEVIDGWPVDRIDDGNSALTSDATQMTVYVRYSGFGAYDSATLMVTLDGARVGEPSVINIDPSGDGYGTIVIGAPDGGAVAIGAYHATVILDGVTVAEADAAVVPAS